MSFALCITLEAPKTPTDNITSDLLEIRILLEVTLYMTNDLGSNKLPSLMVWAMTLEVRYQNLGN